jgi:hypothetical protein
MKGSGNSERLSRNVVTFRIENLVYVNYYKYGDSERMRQI